jgi:type I restriction enzyme S subunit
MTQTFHLDNLEIITQAPNGIKLLRQLVLRHAISGRLVRQDLEDGSGLELVEKVLNSRGIKVGIENQPNADIPKNWGRAKLGEIFYLEMGQSPNSDSYNSQREGLPFYQGKTDFGSFVPTPRLWCSSPTKIAEVGDVLLSVRAPVGPTNFADERCCIGRGLAAVRPLGGVQTEFVLWWLRAYETQIAEMGTGTTFIAVSKKNLEPFMIAIPPLAEQNRILHRINELMKLCDTLESQFSLRDSLSTAARRSAVDAISTAQSQKEFEIAWNRIQLNWEVIAGTPESIESLRNLILSLAISGNLTKGFISKDSVRELLDNVGERINPYPEMSDERFAIPTHWKWVPLASIAEHQLGKMLHTAKMRGTRRQYLRSVNVRPDGTIDLTDLNEMLIPDSEIEKYSVVKGDLFVNEGGDVGRNAIFDLDIDFELAFQNQLHRLRPVCEIESRYIQFVLRQAKSQGILAQMSSGVTIQHFSATALRKFAVPLPPLSEQNLIVEKVNQLMKFCDELERGMLKKSDFAEKYARSVVSASA